MASFVLDILSNTTHKKFATLTIAANSGTDPEGFGWDWFGGGFNTGGTWTWLWGEDPKKEYSIGLRTDKDEIFGFLSANWSPVQSPNGYPPQPWFSEQGVNLGEVSVLIDASGKYAKWRLKKAFNK